MAALLVGVLAPSAASAVQSAELFRTQASFYGRFEARVRYAPGEGVVSSFFLWKDGSSSATSWNELDYEKVNSTCRLTTNIWTGTGTQSSQTNTTTFDVCADYHTYAFEWTPDCIAWFIDGTQIRLVTGASVTEYTQNASQGMAIHFNVWAGDASFGGTLSPSTLPVRQYISWVQYSSYANGAFQMQWREEFNGSTVPSGWAVGNWPSPFNLSTHNAANVSFVNGIAVLSMTAAIDRLLGNTARGYIRRRRGVGNRRQGRNGGNRRQRRWRNGHRGLRDAAARAGHLLAEVAAEREVAPRREAAETSYYRPRREWRGRNRRKRRERRWWRNRRKRRGRDRRGSGAAAGSGGTSAPLGSGGASDTGGASATGGAERRLPADPREPEAPRRRGGRPDRIRHGLRLPRRRRPPDRGRRPHRGPADRRLRARAPAADRAAAGSLVAPRRRRGVRLLPRTATSRIAAALR